MKLIQAREHASWLSGTRVLPNNAQWPVPRFYSSCHADLKVVVKISLSFDRRNFLNAVISWSALKIMTIKTKNDRMTKNQKNNCDSIVVLSHFVSVTNLLGTSPFTNSKFHTDGLRVDGFTRFVQMWLRVENKNARACFGWLIWCKSPWGKFWFMNIS